MIYASILCSLALFGTQRAPAAEVDYGTDYRIRGNVVSNYPVNDSGQNLGRNTFGIQRLRISPAYRYSETLRFGGEIDFFSGQNLGQYPTLGTSYAVFPGNTRRDFTRTVDPRHLWVEWQSPVGLVRAGQQGSQWGLGILANDGEGKDTIWGDAFFGDIVERVLFATKPFLPLSREGLGKDIILALGADLVYRDSFAGLVDGDRAYQGIVSVIYHGERTTGGFYIAYRDQTYPSGDTLNGTGYDVYGRSRIHVEALDGEVELAGEGVVLQGSTSRFRTSGGPAGVDILGAGGAVRAGLTLHRLGLAFTAEAGYASGDNDPNDGTFRTFAFNRDYNIGLILYKEVLTAVSAVGADRAADANLVGYPPSGIEKLPTDGAVRNSYYLFPTVSYLPMDNVRADLGFLTAWVDSPFVDPYLTFRAGGVPRTYRNVFPPSPHLGYELDGSVRYSENIGSVPGLKYVIGLQYGYFIPGKAFNDAQDIRFPDVQKVQLRLDLLWS